MWHTLPWCKPQLPPLVPNSSCHAANFEFEAAGCCQPLSRLRKREGWTAADRSGWEGHASEFSWAVDGALKCFKHLSCAVLLELAQVRALRVTVQRWYRLKSSKALQAREPTAPATAIRILCSTSLRSHASCVRICRVGLPSQAIRRGIWRFGVHEGLVIPPVARLRDLNWHLNWHLNWLFIES